MFSKYANSPRPGKPILGIRILIMFTLIVVFLSIIPKAYCKNSKYSRSKTSKSSTLIAKPEWVRKRSKSSECRLGRIRYPLNATWSPDLGPPFGIWKCVKCTCTPVQKKRRIVAKVFCRNIKNECPKVKCPNAVLTPGSCCKICPGLHHRLSPEDYLQEEPEDIDIMSNKDFAVLLNGRTSMSPLTTKKLGTGRIFLRRGTLHYSFVFSGSTIISPLTVQFMNKNGDILEELEPQPTPYEVNNGRLCGTWTRVPRQYRTLLLNEQLWVALVPPEGDDIISGKISRYKGVDTEVFSALLSPSNGNGSSDGNGGLSGGGTAIISVSASSDSLHVSLVFNGIFDSNDARNVTISVELRPPSRSALPPVVDKIVLPKVYSDINVAEVKTTLGEKSLRLLARGKVTIIVTSVDSPQLRLEGAVIARATCNVYHSVLTSESESNLVTLEPMFPYGAGWGILYVLNNGDFKYRMKLEGLPTPATKVMLQLKSRKKTRNLEDVTDSLKDGWVNGTYGNPTYRDLDTLFRGRLQVEVTTSSGSVLKGLFESVSVTEALRSLHPSLLKNPSSWMAATTWVAVDEDCVMHYDIYLAGDDPTPGVFDPTWSLQLRENDTSWDPRLDLVNVTLERIVSGREIAAHTTVLSKISLSRLRAGVSYLDLSVSDPDTKFDPPSVTLTGLLSDVRVPPLCLLYPEGGVEELKKPKTGSITPGCRNFGCLDEQEKPSISKKCIDDGKRVYEDGSTWKSPAYNCARCMCTLGKINCQNEPCPKPLCSDPITLPGQCCRSCPAVSGKMSERVCKMDDDNLRNIGSFWHPFLAPKGFDLCVTCYCNVTSTGDPVVECSRVSCPLLKCLDSVANFRDENSCCPKCPRTTPAPLPPFYPLRSSASGDKDYVDEEVKEITEEERTNFILKHGGCLERNNIPRPNGDRWFPDLFFNSVSRCISCTCKDSRITCSKDLCPQVRCKKGGKCRKKKDNYRKSKKNSFHRKKKSRRKNKKKRIR